MMLKTKYTIVITIFLVGFQISLHGNQPNNDEQFSKNLETLRKISSDLSLRQGVLIDLMVTNPAYRGNAISPIESYELIHFIMDVGEILSPLHIYILQLNTFDTAPPVEEALKIPERSTEYCCWKSISLTHKHVRNKTYQALNAEPIKNTNLQSPQVFHEIKSNLEKLNVCLSYFDDYFANRE